MKTISYSELMKELEAYKTPRHNTDKLTNEQKSFLKKGVENGVPYNQMIRLWNKTDWKPISKYWINKLVIELGYK
jgi:hypothetical protein